MYMYMYLYLYSRYTNSQTTKTRESPAVSAACSSQISTFRSSPFVSPGGEIRDEPIDISKVADPENMDIVDKPLWREHGVASLGR